MKTLSLDLESYSEVDIKTAGLYKYAAASEVLMLAYSYDYGPVEIIDLSWEELPQQLIDDILDPAITKTAFNAAFERAVLGRLLGAYLPPEQWIDTMILSAMAGLPLSLEESAKALNLEQQKDTVGKQLIRYFCMPCKPTKANGMRERNLPQHDLAKWELFLGYCKQDVVTEQAIAKALDWLNIPEIEHKLWCLDQRINERGVKVDINMARHAIQMDLDFRERLTAEAVELTGLANPNSVAQIKKWLEEQDGVEIKSLNKDILGNMAKKATGDSKRLLEIRQDMSKTSVKKYTAMINAAGDGHRLRGLFQFCGANKTYRWAGRLVQLQNFPRGSLKPEALDCARDLVLANDMVSLEMCVGAVPDSLSSLLRSAIIPDKENELMVADYNAIEAVLLSWLASEQWRLDVFNSDGKIYETAAAIMFKVPKESITKDSPLRQKSKISELACGYAGGVGALLKMGAVEQGIVPQEIMDLPEDYREYLDIEGKRYLITKEKKIKAYLQTLITAWRKASPAIVALWKQTQAAAIQAIKTGEKVPVTKGMYFQMKNKNLLMWLPAGRFICYPNASIRPRTVIEEVEIIDRYGNVIIEENRRTTDTIHYWGVNQTTRKWEEQTTYSGKLVENWVQGFARDCLGNGLLNVDAAGYPIVVHVHDEIVADVPKGFGSIEEFEELMVKKAPWMGDLPLKAEAFTASYYRK